MCCFFVILMTAGPRLAGALWWLVDPQLWSRTFSNVLWPILGIIFVPWMTLMYVLVAPGGITGFDWLWIGLGLLADFSSYGGGAKHRMDRAAYPTPTSM